MHYKRLWLAVLLAGVGLLAACATPGADPTPAARLLVLATTTPVPTYQNITPDQLVDVGGGDIFLVNTHEPYEGEIPSTTAFIPAGETEQRLDEFPAEKSTQIVVYSLDGSMSVAAAEILVKVGYTSVWNLSGGMAAWEATGYEIIR